MEGLTIATQELVVRFAAEEDLGFVSQDAHLPHDTILHKLGRDEIIVAELDERKIGYVRFEYLWSVVPYLSLILVLESERRNGVGSALLAHLESQFAVAGHEVLLSSSQADEPAPQAWHRRMGFEECGFISGINKKGVGEVFFRKNLLLE